MFGRDDLDSRYRVGVDVGSTTVKAVVVDTGTDTVVWRDYRRHDTRQADMLLDFLRRMEREAGIHTGNGRIFMTGAGGNTLADLVGAKFVQEVLAASLTVERLCPGASAIVEIGGQDAKIVVLRKDPESGRIKKIPSMNDKCAGGTGAVIDKISAKLGIPQQSLSQLRYSGIRVHAVAGKCGVFAETDINSLQKQGIPPEELMASLFDAFVLQNLKVLARGHTLMPEIILLGGPNAFIPGMREAWQHNITLMWEERGVALPEGTSPEGVIRAPEHAEYYGAIGAAEYGKEEDLDVGRYRGTSQLEFFVGGGRIEGRGPSGVPGLVGSEEEVEAFLKAYAPPRFVPPRLRPGTTVSGYIGVDGGSTSTKAVLVSEDGEVMAKAYQLSKGNPIKDTVEILEKLRAQVESQGAGIEVLGVATTGYAKDTLRDVICADVALVETVAHAKSALHYYEAAGRHRGCGRPGHQADHPEGRARQGLQAQHPVLGGKRLLPAGDRGRVRPESGAIRGPGLHGAFDARVPVRVRRLPAGRHRQLPGPGMEAARDPGRARGGAAQERVAVHREDPEPARTRHAVHPAGRHPEQPCGGKSRGGLHPLALPGFGPDA